MADEKTPKHVSQLTNILDTLKDEVIMYGFDEQENTDKQIPMSLFMDEFESLSNRIYILENSGATTITISNFNVIKNIGLYSKTHNHIFTGILDRSVIASQVNAFTLVYGTTTINLVNSGVFKTGVDISYVGTHYILTIDITELNQVALNENTSFLVSLTLLDGSNGTAVATYTNLPLVTISGFTVNESHSEGYSTVSGTINITNYDARCTYIANIGDGTDGPLGSLDVVMSSGAATYEFPSFAQLSESVIMTLTVTQTIDEDSYTVTDTEILPIVAEEYSMICTVTDDIPEAIELALVSAYSDAETTNLVEAGYSNSSGIVTLTLPNGSYYLIISKDNYESETRSITIASATYELTVILEPVMAFEYTPYASNPVLGETMYVYYDLLPDNKYEDECTIVYTVKDLDEVVVTTETKTLTGDPTTYKTLAVDAGWSNLFTIDIDITSEYKTQTLNYSFQKTIGEAVAKWGVIDSSITDLTGLTTTYLLSDILTEVVLSAAEEYVPDNTSNPRIRFQQYFYYDKEEDTPGSGISNGYQWVAFPTDDYPAYTMWGDEDDATTNPFTGTDADAKGFIIPTSIGAVDYTIYIFAGTGFSYNDLTFGEGGLTFNIKLA